MVNVDLEKEELEQIILMMEGATVPLGAAEKGIKLLNKFKEARK